MRTFLATSAILAVLAAGSLAAQGTPAPPRTPSIAGKAKKKPAPRIVERPPFIDFLDGQHVLAETFSFAIAPGTRPIVVPRGFVTDYASIPELAKPLFAGLPHDLPGMVHDFLYWTHVCRKEQADRVFLSALVQLGVPKASARLMFSAVAAGGGPAWDENRRDRAAGLPRIIPAEYMHIPANAFWSNYRTELRDLHHVQLDKPDPGLMSACRVP
jgi:hypothetical protein